MEKNELIAKYEPSRTKAGVANKIFLGLCIAFAAVGTVFFILGLRNADAEQNPMMVGFVFGMFFAVIFGFIARGIANKFSKKLVAEMRKGVMERYFPERKEEPKAGFTLQQLMHPGFFSTPDRWKSSDYFESSYNGIPFKSSKYKFERREVHHSSNGGTTVSYVTYAEGTMYFFDFEREFGQTVKIMEKSGPTNGSMGLKKCETEFIEFNKKFYIFASDETQVFYLLTPQIQEKILALEKIFKGSFDLGFVGSDLWVAINDEHTSLNVNVRKPLTEEVLTKLEMVIATPKLIIDNLGLDKNKFKHNAGVNA